MKVGFIGLGRMGQAMSRRLLDGGYEVAVYNRTADKIKPLHDLGAKSAASIGEVSNFGRAVFTMLTDDAAVMDVVGSPAAYERECPREASTFARERTVSRLLARCRTCTSSRARF